MSRHKKGLISGIVTTVSVLTIVTVASKLLGLLREVGIFPEDQVELFINENGELVIQKVTDDMMDDVSPESWVLVTPLPMIHPELIRD